jgi:hypothetical protein
MAGAGAVAATRFMEVTAIAEPLQAVLVAIVADHAALPATFTDTVAALAAVHVAATAAVLEAATAAVADMQAALAVAAAMAAAVALAVAATAVAAADIGKQFRLSSKRLVCFGRRAFILL